MRERKLEKREREKKNMVKKFIDEYGNEVKERGKKLSTTKTTDSSSNCYIRYISSHKRCATKKEKKALGNVYDMMKWRWWVEKKKKKYNPKYDWLDGFRCCV